MLTVVFGLLSSLSYATSDMLSQRVTRQAQVTRVVLWVLGVGVVLVLPPALVFDGLPAGGAQWRAAGFCVIAGIAYLAAYSCLLAGLQRGDLSLVTALSALQGAFVAVWAIGTGESVTLVVGVGLVLAVAGGTLSALQGRARTTAGAGWALVSGVLFMAVVVLYDHAQALSWLSVAAISRISSFLVLVPLVLVTGAGWRLAPRLRGIVAGAGALEVLGVVLLTGSVAIGPLAIAGVMVSQFATFGVLLGLIVLRERPRPHQLAGVACTLVAVSVLAATSGGGA